MVEEVRLFVTFCADFGVDDCWIFFWSFEKVEVELGINVRTMEAGGGVFGIWMAVQ